MNKTHDYTNTASTSHHKIIQYTPKVINESLYLIGEGSGVEINDYIIFSLPNNKDVAKYQVTAIKYPDKDTYHWHAEVTFIPRSNDV